MVSNDIYKIIFLNVGVIDRIPDANTKSCKKSIKNEAFDQANNYVKVIKITQDKGIDQDYNQPYDGIPY